MDEVAESDRPGACGGHRGEVALPQASRIVRNLWLQHVRWVSEIRAVGAYLKTSLPRLAVAGLVALAVVLAPPGARAQEPACDRPELSWEVWLAFTMSNNPGMKYAEVEGLERDRLLSEFSCKGDGASCPPDRVYVFNCEGNAMVLVAFVKDQCVTLAEEIEVLRFLNVVGGNFEC